MEELKIQVSDDWLENNGKLKLILTSGNYIVIIELCFIFQMSRIILLISILCAS